MIGGVFNASNTHWASFLVDAQRKSLLIFETARFVSHNFGVVFLRALAQVMDDPQVAHWEVRVLGEKSGIMCQIDGKSCGVYACIILQSDCAALIRSLSLELSRSSKRSFQRC